MSIPGVNVMLNKFVKNIVFFYFQCSGHSGNDLPEQDTGCHIWVCNNGVHFTQFFCAEWVVKAVFGVNTSWVSVMKILILPINTFDHIQHFQSLNDNQANFMHKKN